jgi:hypothetical protein
MIFQSNRLFVVIWSLDAIVWERFNGGGKYFDFTGSQASEINDRVKWPLSCWFACIYF